MFFEIQKLWDSLYPKDQRYISKLEYLIKEGQKEIDYKPDELDWHQEGIVYSLYVDLFASDFKGLIKKLDYLYKLGVNTLWLLPILESPMVDQGFDISNYYKIRSKLGTNQEFIEFIKRAHQKNIKIVFDIAVNHTSNQHMWFKNARKSKNSQYRDFYIWNENKEKYQDTRLLLKGISNSNWTYNKETDDYYFHRFYDIQPDLNYKNPEVLYEMIKAFTYWISKGVDGFRMDAAPFLWKKEGTDCENLSETHKILKIFRATFDAISEGTVMIAEANQKPEDIIEYLGNGDECHVVYNFPIMPKIFLSIAEHDPDYIIKQLAIIDNLEQPDNTAWFTFLRCHDELTLEFVTEKERELMNKHYLKEEKWTFRDGEGISGRLYNLLDQDVSKVLLAYSILFSIKGTPIIYFGDEIAMENDLKFYNKMNDKFGYTDSRYLNRGPFDEQKKETALKEPSSDHGLIYRGLKEMINLKNDNLKIFKSDVEYEVKDNLLISKRKTKDKILTIVNNLKDESSSYEDYDLKPYEYIWILEENI